MANRSHFIGALLLLAVAAPASALSYSSLYVFGDSLVDSGNAYGFTAGAQPSTANGYYQGRFSNGYNFADYLATDIGVSVPSPAIYGGTNVAVGGAEAETKPGQSSLSFLSQIGFYTSFIATTIPSDALVLVTFGGNDVRATRYAGGVADFSGAATDFATGLSYLYGLGARNFVITGAPDIGALPDSVAAVGDIDGRLHDLTMRSQQISDLFQADAGALNALPGTNVTFFDLLGFENRVLADPAAYGLPATLDSTTPCQTIGGGVPQVAQCANSLYFDTIHPTTQIHAVIAGAIAAQLPVPEVATWALMIGGFGAVGMRLRRQRTALAA